jgi:hypothetical protein
MNAAEAREAPDGRCGDYVVSCSGRLPLKKQRMNLKGIPRHPLSPPQRLYYLQEILLVFIKISIKKNEILKVLPRPPQPI